MYKNSNSTVFLWQCIFYIFLFFFVLHCTTVLWIPKNALKSRVLYLQMLSLSLSVSSSPRYNCKICELQLVSVTEQTRYTLHWCQAAQVNDCSVTFSNLLWVISFLCLTWCGLTFPMLLSSRHFKCMHLWKCILYYRLDLWIEVALQQKNAWTVNAVFTPLILLSLSLSLA